jgi:hypothetical protein
LPGRGQQGELLGFGDINGKNHGFAVELLAQFRPVYFVELPLRWAIASRHL